MLRAMFSLTTVTTTNRMVSMEMTTCWAKQAKTSLAAVLKTVTKVATQPCSMVVMKNLQLLILAAVSFKFQRVKKLTMRNALRIINSQTNLSPLNN